MKNIALLMAFFSVSGLMAQTANDTTTSAETEKPTITVGGYVDVYYGYDFSQPESGDRLYFVSSSRHNEFTVNLAYVDVKYSSERVRGRFVPAIGTYMAANYAAEAPIFRYLLEANAGVKLAKNKEIWLDAGVFTSPYTNENPISKDHLMYTRSFAPEYVPYYISGLRLAVPLGEKLTTYFYLLNGWQNIQETNKGKSGTIQLEYKPVDNLLINWNVYAGDESNDADPDNPNRTRYFTDVFLVFNPDGKFSGTSSLYIGAQERQITDAAATESRTDYWQNANIIGRYRFTPQLSLSGRLEYFRDPNSVQITPVTGVDGFETFSSSLGVNYAVTDQVLLRAESRTFFSPDEVYLNPDEQPSNSSQLLIGSIAISF